MMHKNADCRIKISAKIFVSVICLILLPHNLSANQGDGAIKKGSATGFPLPRFASLKSDKVNVRIGPDGEKYKIKWVYRKEGLPVEIIAESENWRHVRDSEGVDGWVFHSLLSGRRTALVMPWAKKTSENPAQPVPLYRSRSDDKTNVAFLVESGVLAHVISCNGKWCKLSIDDHQGWLQQEKLWGVYQQESIE